MGKNWTWLDYRVFKIVRFYENLNIMTGACTRSDFSKKNKDATINPGGVAIYLLASLALVSKQGVENICPDPGDNESKNPCQVYQTASLVPAKGVIEKVV